MHQLVDIWIQIWIQRPASIYVRNSFRNVNSKLILLDMKKKKTVTFEVRKSIHSCGDLFSSH